MIANEIPPEVEVAYTLMIINKGFAGVCPILFGAEIIKMIQDTVIKYPEWFKDA